MPQLIKKVATDNPFNRSWLKGAIYGLALGLTIATLSFFDLAENTPFESTVQFFSSLPVFITIKLLPTASEPFLATIYFIYWIILGAIIGQAASMGTVGKLSALLLIIFLVFAHYKADIAMQKELEGVMEGFLEFILKFPQTGLKFSLSEWLRH